MLWELAAAPKNTLFTHPRPSTTDEPHMNNCPHGLDGCEVRLCDAVIRVPVSRVCPGSPRAPGGSPGVFLQVPAVPAKSRLPPVSFNRKYSTNTVQYR